jgi:outer membrane protein assembly factor BamB
MVFGIAMCSVVVQAQTPTIKWWFDTDDSSFGQSAMEDLNGDGNQDVVFGCYRNDSMVYALNGNDGSLLWKFNAAGSGEGCNDVAMLIYDVDADGSKEVIVPSSCNPKTFCFNGADGTVKWAANTSGSDSPPVIADLNQDGVPDVMHGEFGGSVRSLNAQTGAQNWHFYVDANSWIQTAPTTVDLDGNGQMDFVVATWHFSNQDAVYAYNGADNSLMWSYPLTDVVYHGTAVADLDNNGTPELVIGDYSGTLSCLNSDGTLKWSYYAGAYVGSPASIGDIDGDGMCEIVFCSYYRIIALNHDGSLLWNYDLSGISTSFRGVALVDMNNDTKPDPVFGTSNGEVIALNGINGSLLWSVDLQSHYGNVFEIDHAPVIGDMDQDGFLDVFVVGGYTEYPNFSVNYGRGYALSTSQPATPGNEWKMFQYDTQRRGSLCSYSSNGIVENSGAKVTVYPNPLVAGTELKINAESTFITGIKITDVYGRQILQKPVANQTETNISVNAFAVGVYFVEVQMAETSVIRKIVVE